MTIPRKTLALIALLFGTQAVDAQVQERTAQAALDDLQDDGEIENASLFLFQGCPQVDPAGRAVFDAVSRVQLDPDGLLSLAIAWKTEYATCNYAPLDRWFVGALNQVLSQRHGRAALGFLFNLPAEIPDAVQEGLLAAATDEAWGDDLRPMFAATAIHNRRPDRQVSEALAAFRRNVPMSWIHSESQRLGRTYGRQFFSAVLREAPTMNDRVLNLIGAAIGGDVRDRFVDGSEASVGQLRAYLRTRPGIEGRSQIP